MEPDKAELVGQLWTPEKTNIIEIEWVRYFNFILKCIWYNCISFKKTTLQFVSGSYTVIKCHTDNQHGEPCLIICFEKGVKIWIWIKLELNLNWIWIKFGLHWKVGQLWTPEKTNYIEIEWVQYLIFILNSQFFWKWTNANPMKIFRQTATVSNLTL